jgi:hypothetical protein
MGVIGLKVAIKIYLFNVFVHRFNCKIYDRVYYRLLKNK